jgi:hypothetical protein
MQNPQEQAEQRNERVNTKYMYSLKQWVIVRGAWSKTYDNREK